MNIGGKLIDVDIMEETGNRSIRTTKEIHCIMLVASANREKLGYVEYTIDFDQKLLYVHMVENLTKKPGIQPITGIGRVLHDLLLKKSVELGVYRVALDAQHRSAGFHYRCGFRVRPESDLCYSKDKKLQPLYTKARLFWQAIADRCERTQITAFLVAIFQELQQNIQLYIPRLHLDEDELSKLTLALASGNIAECCSMLFPTFNSYSARVDTSLDMFLPQKFFIDSVRRLGLAPPGIMPDPDSRLYSAMHETDYAEFITEEVKLIMTSIKERLNSAPTAPITAATQSKYTPQFHQPAEEAPAVPAVAAAENPDFTTHNPS